MTDTLDPAEDEALDPSIKPKSSKAWLASIVDAEKAFDQYQRKADAIDKLYADLNKLASDVRDREFQLFWANIEVLKPSIYARPPVPVVTPKFKDRRPLYRTASELLERCCIVSFDLADIDQVMRQVRDDLAVNGRGVPWVRYETKGEDRYPTERVCIEHKDRKDFLHQPAREWSEVGWVAGAAYMTRKEMRKRFRKTSGDAYQTASFNVLKDDKDDGGADNRQKAKVWEVWSKTENRVVWVTEGVESLLDDGEPHLKLEGFYPCPRPAYGTTQRRSLIPVPDVLFYKDQLEEINDTTARIHALADSLQVKGFYPAGAGEIGDAIQAALDRLDNRQILVGVSNWAMLGQGAPNDMIVWLPIDQVASVIVQLVELRRQMIEDVYQIMGLSDIMRGMTDAQETLGAQELKSQYGSVRIRDKVSELVRVARDLVRIAAEIMAENFSKKTLLDMSQMQIPTDAEIAGQIKELEQQAREQLDGMARQALAQPGAAEQAQQNPEQARALVAQATQQIEAQLAPQIAKLEATPTQEKVMAFLHDQKIRPFVLDIETDSTIQPDEQREKEQRTEFLSAFMQASQGLGQMVAAAPEAAPLAGEMLKFVLAPYRAGRSMEQAIDDFVESVNKRASQPPPPNPEQIKAEADAEASKASAQADTMRAQAEAAKAQSEGQEAQVAQVEKLAGIKSKSEEDALNRQIKAQEAQDASAQRRQDLADKAALADMQRKQQAEKHMQDMELGRLNIDLLNTKITQANVATKNSLETTAAGVAATKAKATQQPEAR
jgi:hypothetical protein